MDSVEYKITQEETKQIRDLFYEKRTLMELISSVSSDGPIYDKLKTDFVTVNRRYQEWFAAFERKYNARGLPDASWEVDFSGNIVRLVKAGAK